MHALDDFLLRFEGKAVESWNGPLHKHQDLKEQLGTHGAGLQIERSKHNVRTSERISLVTKNSTSYEYNEII